MVQHNTPVDELAAVNIILSVIGQPPVNSLAGELSPDAAKARLILGETSRSFQNIGWDFNKEYNVPFQPDVNGEVIIPSDVLSLSVTTYRYGPRDIIRRGNRMYDRGRRTYQFEMPFWADVTYLRPFEELTESARYYVTIRAARILSNRVAPSKVVYQFTKEDEIEAKSNFLDEDGNLAQYSMLDSPTSLQALAPRTQRVSR